MFRCCRSADTAIAPGPIAAAANAADYDPIIVAARSSVVAARGDSGGATPNCVGSPAYYSTERSFIAEVNHAVVLAHTTITLKQRSHFYKLGATHSLFVDPTGVPIFEHIQSLMGDLSITELSHLDCEANLGDPGGPVNKTLIPALKECFEPETGPTGLVRVTLYSGSGLREELQKLLDDSSLSDESLSKIVYFEKGKEQSARAFQRSVVLEEKPRPAFFAGLSVHVPSAVYAVAHTSMGTPVVLDVSTPSSGTPGGGRRSTARVTPMPAAVAAGPAPDLAT